MPLSRRECLIRVAGGFAASFLAMSSPVRTAASPTVKAIAFDAFAIFDVRPISALAEQLVPGKGAELISAWRARQFEYQWLRNLAGHYADFWEVTEDALVYATKLLKLDLSGNERGELMGAYLQLRSWPEAPLALAALKSEGIRLAFLSNATPQILNGGISNSRLEGVFEHVLSTDQIKSYKPNPRAYQMAVEAFGLRREEIVFVAFAGWDAVGARWFGYPTFWVNRLELPGEELGVAPDAIGVTVNDLVSFVKTSAYESSSAPCTPRV